MKMDNVIGQRFAKWFLLPINSYFIDQLTVRSSAKLFFITTKNHWKEMQNPALAIAAKH